jgi:hypothetical protein
LVLAFLSSVRVSGFAGITTKIQYMFVPY